FQGWPIGVAAIVFLIVYQQIENNVFQPVIHRYTVQLNPLWVILAVLIGGTPPGILGPPPALPVRRAPPGPGAEGGAGPRRRDAASGAGDPARGSPGGVATGARGRVAPRARDRRRRTHRPWWGRCRRDRAARRRGAACARGRTPRWRS